MITLIVAMGKNHEIGFNNKMPWHLPNDLRYFKETTTGHIVIMGRKTYESIGKLLPNRKNIVLTRRTTGDYPQEVDVIRDINEIKKIAKENSDKHVFVIGGANVYEQVLPLADHLFITSIDHTFKADAFFPKFNESEWEEVSCQKGKRDERNPYNYSFLQLSRK